MKSLLGLVVLVLIVGITFGYPQRNARKGALLPTKCLSGTESSAPTPVNLICEQCDAAPGEPCILKKGETYSFEVDFDVPRDTRNLTAIVHGIIEGIEVPWNGVSKNGCEDMLVGECPLRAGDYWTYGVGIKVEPLYPATPLIVKWQLRDESNTAIWCFHMPAQIIN